ncbi:hypothetical protein RUM43_012448 [Polyplax serrata]|uniref:Uncharacterized protein n=1 Tax=Polyplax serrata TaxID=468196 RepID=A0AAN8S7G8_POLSC
MTKVRDISGLTEAAQNFAEAYKRHKFGILEKQLIAATIVLGILSVVFCVLFFVTGYNYNKLLRDKVCNSNECIESAMTLLQTVDFSQDPCQDFYKFACGKFPNDHPLNENDLHNSWFIEKDSQLNGMILNILKSPILETDLKIIRETKEFYQSCINKSQFKCGNTKKDKYSNDNSEKDIFLCAGELNEIGLQPLYDILEMLELPKSFPTKETIQNFNLGRTLALAQRHLSQDILVSVSIVKESTNTTSASTENINVFKLSPGPNTLGMLDIWDSKRNTLDLGLITKIFRKEDKEKHTSKNTESLTKHVKNATVKFIATMIQKIKDDLDDEMNMTQNQNSINYISAAQGIMNFSSLLPNNMEDEADEEMEKNKTMRTTFSELGSFLEGENSTVPISNRIDWKEYLLVLLQNVNKTYDMENGLLLVDNLNYFRALSKVLEVTTPETIQRHIWWKIIEHFAKFTTTDIRGVYLRFYMSVYGETSLQPRSQVCTNLMKGTMAVALSYEMATLNNITKTSHKVLQMLKDIEKAFEEIVNSTSWMDEKTKSITLEKAQAVRHDIGYASWVTKPEKITEYYKGLELKKSEFLMNIIRVAEWEVGQILKTLGQPKGNSTHSTSWYINPLQVNAYYSHVDNAIIIPAGILRTPFYFRGLESLNYGAIGTILGHELTHGFDIDGKNYNKFGEQQENFWPSEIIAEYERRAKCFVNQYENYTLYEGNRLNGTFTLAENIADNGGIRESFKAYQLYAARHGQEPKLPGFENFTHEQLLFLSYANIWCEAANPKFYMLSQDSHSPQRIRVLVTLQNMKEFSEVYKCSSDSFMNPSNKCKLW